MTAMSRGARIRLSAVSVAKRLRRQVVALEIEGSNPFAHPT